MGKNNIFPIPHHVKERLRHQNLQAILEHVASSVPKSPMYEKETKAKKLRRILLYSEYLQRELLRLKLETKITSSGDDPSVNNEENQNFEDETSPGKAQVVFLKKLENSVVEESEATTQLETVSESLQEQERKSKKRPRKENNQETDKVKKPNKLQKCDENYAPNFIVKSEPNECSSRNTRSSPDKNKIAKSSPHNNSLCKEDCKTVKNNEKSTKSSSNNKSSFTDDFKINSTERITKPFLYSNSSLLNDNKVVNSKETVTKSFLHDDRYILDKVNDNKVATAKSFLHNETSFLPDFKVINSKETITSSVQNNSTFLDDYKAINSNETVTNSSHSNNYPMVAKTFRNTYPHLYEKYYSAPNGNSTSNKVVLAKKSKPKRKKNETALITSLKKETNKICENRDLDEPPLNVSSQPSDISSSVESALAVSSSEWLSSDEGSFAKSASQGSSSYFPSSSGSLPFEDLYENFCDLEKEFSNRAVQGVQPPLPDLTYHHMDYNQINVQQHMAYPQPTMHYNHPQCPSKYQSGGVYYMNNDHFVWQQPCAAPAQPPYNCDFTVPPNASGYNLMCPVDRDYPSSGSSTFVRIKQEIPDSLSESVALAMGLSSDYYYSGNAY